MHCYLLTLFLGQGADALKISSVTSVKGEEAGEDGDGQGICQPPGLSAGRMAVRALRGV